MAFGILYSLRVSGIYKIVNTANGKFYVGSSIAIKDRWAQHITRLRRSAHGNQHLQSAFHKHGEDAFRFEVIEQCSESDVLGREQYYIDTLRPEYNICLIAGRTIGYRHTENGRAKISSAKTGKTSPRKGVKHTAETRLKISASKTGVRLTTEQVERHRKVMMGRKNTLGHKWTDAHRDKLRAASLAKWSDPDWKAQQVMKIKAGKAAQLALSRTHYEDVET